MANIKDVSEFASAETPLPQGSRSAESAHVQAARRLLRMACHDLCEPLNTLHMCAQAALLAVQKGDSIGVASLSEILGRMERLARTGAALVSDVLSVDQVHSAMATLPSSTSSTDVEEALASAIAIQSEALLRANCQIIVTRPEGTARICGPWNRPAVVSVFSNLLQNSCRYAAGEPITIEIAQVGRHLRISFTDGGPSLSKDPKHEATSVSGLEGGPRHGLGLWIVSEAVAALGGRITIGMPSDRGLSVQVLLPLRQSEPDTLGRVGPAPAVAAT
jgi:signal transduction histidine kinase